MNEDAVRGFSRAFCDAWIEREPQRIAPFLHDDIDWVVFGPVDLFPFFGRRRGKQAALAVVKQMSEHLLIQGCQHEMATSDDGGGARLVRLNAMHTESGRIVSLRMAHFCQFTDGKLTRFMALFDSFDAAEQVLGRQIDLNRKLRDSYPIAHNC